MDEREIYFQIIIKLEKTVADMVKAGMQNGAGNDAIVYLHYSLNGAHWYIMEQDIRTIDNKSEPVFFGLANQGMGMELAYFSVEDLLNKDTELDLNFQQTTLGLIKSEHKITCL